VPLPPSAAPPTSTGNNGDSGDDNVVLYSVVAGVVAVNGLIGVAALKLLLNFRAARRVLPEPMDSPVLALTAAGEPGSEVVAHVEVDALRSPSPQVMSPPGGGSSYV